MADQDPTQLALLKAEVQSMIILAAERLGDQNPWAAVDVDNMSIQQLSAARRLLHELLYAPPSLRSR